MSVYIPSMEMPTSCYKCPLWWRDGVDIVCPVAHEQFSVADVNILYYRLDNCPLVTVPEHGRLIDADALMEIIKAHDYPLWAHFNSTDNGMFTIGIQQAVDETPTIIPADGKDTNVPAREEGE